MSKQSIDDRRHRLDDGRCPIHGISMCQVGNDLVHGIVHYLVGCPRRNCAIQGTQRDMNAPIVLLPAYEHLLRPIASVTNIATKRHL